MQQAWLKKRLDTFLPALLRKHGIDMWVVPMREYNEDPVFSSITAPETFFARRRTIYVFFDKCAAAGAPVDAAPASSASRSAAPRRAACSTRARSMKAVTAAVGGRQAELWGDEQWMALKQVIEERKPKVIGIDRSTTFAFSDGLSSGELQGMSAALGTAWTSKFRDAERLPLELDRVAAAGRRSVLREDDRARLADDADDVLGEGDRAGHDAHQRSRLVVAAAHQRSGARHLVSAEHRGAAQGRDERSSSARTRSSSRATCCTATSASPSRA